MVGIHLRGRRALVVRPSDVVDTMVPWGTGDDRWAPPRAIADRPCRTAYHPDGRRAALGLRDALELERYRPMGDGSRGYGSTIVPLPGATVGTVVELSYTTPRGRITEAYLNDGMTGGATVFPDFGVEVVPRAGRALFFQHAVLHEGEVIERGVKYGLRSDVMYREG